MPAHPELPRPEDAAVASAAGRARNTLTALLAALGKGCHELSRVAEHTDSTISTADLTVSVTVSPSWTATPTAGGCLRFLALLTSVLEYSTIRAAVLVATTADEPLSRTCGWTVRDGRLHPMNTTALKAAAAPCPGAATTERTVCPAPPRPSRSPTAPRRTHMSEGKLQQPSDDATASAMGHALHALTALLPALGEGHHELSISAERTDGTEMDADLYVSVEPGSWHVEHSAEEYMQFFVLLSFALEGSTVQDAVVIATTAAGTGVRACGWDVRNGWLHPMDTTELQAAASLQSAHNATPCTVCHAPELHHPPHPDGQEHS
ncbi:hypothetical protein [Streptomyces sp. NPDC048002]|uniref:hypothetical protein n=1 Tax=Streptomyces sp. NPDC048002 TaxID=3154344 RepID=UPI0033C6C769